MCNNNDLQFALKQENLILFTTSAPKSNFMDGSFSWEIKIIPAEGTSLKNFKEGVKAFLNDISYKTNSACKGRVIRELDIQRKRGLTFVESVLIINDELIKFINNEFRLDKHMFAKKLIDAGWELI